MPCNLEVSKIVKVSVTEHDADFHYNTDSRIINAAAILTLVGM